MGLSYHFTFTAPASTKPGELEKFLKRVEAEAGKMGFKPTMVLDAKFDNEERREFVRRLTTGYRVAHDSLKGIPMLKEGQVWDHDPNQGACRVIPNSGVLLIVTNEKGQETVFGFFRYPSSLINIHGNETMPIELGNRWFFRDFVNSPDPRYREIARMFTQAGYTEAEKDGFAS